jgi:hypothetical protein
MARPISPEHYRYDPGAYRHKHHGSKACAHFRDEGSASVGVCPSTLSVDEAQRLLQFGVPDFGSNEPTSPPARIYAVHEGVIYEARPTEPGSLTYHGFPWRGRPGHNRLPRAIKRALQEQAEQSGYLKVFKDWLRDYEI